MIKYLGSKRLLAPVIARLAVGAEAATALDLFTGSTRVARALKSARLHVTAVDLATYSEVLARCFIQTDAAVVDHLALADAIAELDALPGRPGYVTRVFSEQARYFQPANAARIDGIRQALEDRWAGTPLYPVLLTALLLAADKVDSTAGVQMAYLKSWSHRSGNPLTLRVPDLLPGPGLALRGDAAALAPALAPVDLAYLDPPYNQHRYFGNYHVWETLIRWDDPQPYGVARKRLDVRDPATRSAFNNRRSMPATFERLVREVRAEVVVVSYNDEAWVTPEQIGDWLRAAGHPAVRLLSFDARRYVGAKIGIHNQRGEKVGTVGRVRNVEYLIVAGEPDRVDAACAAAREAPQPVAQVAEGAPKAASTASAKAAIEGSSRS